MGVYLGKKSGVYATCKRCNWRYQVLAENQSHNKCPFCHPVGKCVHGVQLNAPCEACFKVHQKPWMRVTAP